MEILRRSLVKTRIEVRGMAGYPGKFCGEHMCQSVGQWDREKNPISWKNFLFESVILANGGISTPFHFTVLFRVKQLMALHVTEPPEIANDLPARPDRSKWTDIRGA